MSGPTRQAFAPACTWFVSPRPTHHVDTGGGAWLVRVLLSDLASMWQCSVERSLESGGAISLSPQVDCVATHVSRDMFSQAPPTSRAPTFLVKGSSSCSGRAFANLNLGLTVTSRASSGSP